MPTMVTRKCKNCGDPFMAREADVRRGWAKFCSKSCKAIKQTQETGRGKPRQGIIYREAGYLSYGSGDYEDKGY